MLAFAESFFTLITRSIYTSYCNNECIYFYICWKGHNYLPFLPTKHSYNFKTSQSCHEQWPKKRWLMSHLDHFCFNSFFLPVIKTAEGRAWTLFYPNLGFLWTRTTSPYWENNYLKHPCTPYILLEHIRSASHLYFNSEEIRCCWVHED